MMACKKLHRAGKTLALVVATALLGTLPGCAFFYKAPSVEIMEVQVTSLGLSSGTAVVALGVTNQSGREMSIRGFLYLVEVKAPGVDGSWTTLAEGFFDHALVIPGHETEAVNVPVPFEYAGLGEALRSLLSAGEIPYRVKGEVWIGGTNSGLQVPFRQEGVLKP
jgi:LEA14-like dessication related protein